MIMKALKIFIIFSQLRNYIINFWHAIVAPEAVAINKKAEAIRTLISSFKEIREEERKEIIFQKQMYKELGFPQKEYRLRLKNMIESRVIPTVFYDLKLLMNNNRNHKSN